MPSLPWIPWFASKWLSSKTRLMMNTSERSVYMDLLYCVYEYGGSIPSDPQKLALLAAVSLDEFTAAWPVVGSNFVPLPDDPNMLTNIVALETMQRQASIHEAKSSAGRAGGIASGASRKQKRSKPGSEREAYREDKKREEKNQSREEEREKSAREFLSLYPKATNHDKALRAYMSEIISQELHDALMDGLRRWLESAQWQDSLKEDGGRYVANADRFITDRLWKENPPPRKLDAFDCAAKRMGLDAFDEAAKL